MMKITVLADNSENVNWQSEHGLSLLITQPSGMVLFDTGAGSALPHNLLKAGISAGQIGKIVLSHGHYDHTGGIGEFLPQAQHAELYCGCNITQKRFSLHSNRPVKNLTMPDSAVEAIRMFPTAQLHFVENFSAVDPEFFLTGAIPRNSFEDCGGPFFLDSRGKDPDLITDEIAMLTRDGILIQGCCHSGIINTIEHCRRNKPEIKIKIIVGGLHLLHASTLRLQKTVEYLNELNLEKIILLHCTGEAAVDFLKKHLFCKVIVGQTGECYDF